MKAHGLTRGQSLLLLLANSKNASALRSTRGEHGRPEDMFVELFCKEDGVDAEKMWDLESEERRTPAFGER
jgi:hypothetical protein